MVADNFHAVLEATKSFADKLRTRTSLHAARTHWAMNKSDAEDSLSLHPSFTAV